MNNKLQDRTTLVADRTNATRSWVFEIAKEHGHARKAHGVVLDDRHASPRRRRVVGILEGAVGFGDRGAGFSGRSA